MQIFDLLRDYTSYGLCDDTRLALTNIIYIFFQLLSEITESQRSYGLYTLKEQKYRSLPCTSKL